MRVGGDVTMRNDDHMKPRDRQMQLSGLGLDGERDVQEALEWIDDNPGAYDFMVRNARRLKAKGYVSANYLVNMVRNELHVSIKNGYAPALARIMEREFPDLQGAFRMHKSQADGYV